MTTSKAVPPALPAATTAAAAARRRPGHERGRPARADDHEGRAAEGARAAPKTTTAPAAAAGAADHERPPAPTTRPAARADPDRRHVSRAAAFPVHPRAGTSPDPARPDRADPAHEPVPVRIRARSGAPATSVGRRARPGVPAGGRSGRSGAPAAAGGCGARGGVPAGGRSGRPGAPSAGGGCGARGGRALRRRPGGCGRRGWCGGGSPPSARTGSCSSTGVPTRSGPPMRILAPSWPRSTWPAAGSGPTPSSWRSTPPPAGGRDQRPVRGAVGIALTAAEHDRRRRRPDARPGARPPPGTTPTTRRCRPTARSRGPGPAARGAWREIELTGAAVRIPAGTGARPRRDREGAGRRPRRGGDRRRHRRRRAGQRRRRPGRGRPLPPAGWPVRLTDDTAREDVTTPAAPARCPDARRRPGHVQHRGAALAPGRRGIPPRARSAHRAAGRAGLADGHRHRRELRRRQHREHRRDRPRAGFAPEWLAALGLPSRLVDAAGPYTGSPGWPADRERGSRVSDLLGNPQLTWFLTRASGVVALALLTLSMALGIGASTRMSSARWPRFVTQGLHRNISLFVLVLLAAHVAASVLDDYVTYHRAGILHPVHRDVPACLDGTRHAVVGPHHRADRDEPAAAADRVRDLARGALDFVPVLAAGRRARRWARDPTCARPGRCWFTVACVALVLLAIAWRIVAGWPRRALLRTSAVLVTACAVAIVFTWARQGPFAPGWSKRSGTTQSAGAEVSAPASHRPAWPDPSATGEWVREDIPGSGRRPGRRPARSPANGRPGCGSGGGAGAGRAAGGGRRGRGAAAAGRGAAGRAAGDAGRAPGHVRAAAHRRRRPAHRRERAARPRRRRLPGRGEGAGGPAGAAASRSWSSTAPPATRWGRRTRSSISRLPHLILDGAQVAADAVEARQIKQDRN